MDAESDGRRGYAGPVPAGGPAGAATAEVRSVGRSATVVDMRTESGPEAEVESEPEDAGEPRLGSRAPRFIRASRPLHLSWQVGVFLVGLAVVAAGAAMLVLPGPGWVVIFAGMAIWATEFVWAQLVLRWTKRKVKEAAKKALDPRVRRRNIILTAVGGVIAAIGCGYYVWAFGFQLPWNVAW